MNAHELLDQYIDAMGRLHDAAKAHGCPVDATDPQGLVEWVRLRLVELRHLQAGEQAMPAADGWIN